VTINYRIRIGEEGSIWY